MLEMPSMLKTLLLMSAVVLPSEEFGCGAGGDDDPTAPYSGPVGATYVVVGP